jgi:hypothetical protein
MDTVLSTIIEVICATIVVYILFRENSKTMAREFEARIAKLLKLAPSR